MPTFTVNDEQQSPNLQYSNADYEFANIVINSIKRQQRLPLMLTPTDVFGVMQDVVPKWYKEWPDATQTDQLTFDVDVLANPQKYLDKASIDKRFKLHTNQVLMPPAVYGIYNVFYSNSGYMNRSLLNYAQWNLSWMLASTQVGAFPRMEVDNYMGSVFSMNLLNSLAKEPVKFEYNQHSHILQVYDLGNRQGFISCEVARCLPVEDFYSNPFFRMLIIANVIYARADQIELFGAQLPGDLQINVSVLRSRADKLMDEYSKQVDSENAADFYAIKS